LSDPGATRPHLSRWTWVALVAIAIAQLALAAQLNLAPDEAYYRLWSKYPALSYYDHPPMVAWLIAVGRLVGGDDAFGIRLFGPFLLFAESVLLAGTVRDLGGGRLAMTLAALFFQLTLAGLAIAVVMTPDTALLFFAVLTLRLLAAIVAGGPASLWLGVGLAGGAAMLSKYTALFLGLGILGWLLSSSNRRAALRGPWVWSAAVVAGLVFSPVVVWNEQNGWVSFAKQGGRAGVAYSPSLQRLGSFLAGQAGIATPILAGLLVWALVVMVRRAWRTNDDVATLLVATSVPSLAYLTFYALGTKAEANWTLIGIPSAVLAMSLAIDERWQLPPRWLRATTYGGYALGTVLCALVVVHAILPLGPSFGRADPISRLEGYAELSDALVDLAAREQGAQIVTGDYGTAALIAYYTRDRDVIVLQVTERERYRDIPPPPGADLAHHPVLAVTSLRSDRTSELAGLFDKLEPLTVLERRYRGQVVEKFQVYRATGWHGQL
jgi:4-amino-4-deoxy-L-arabinose transferase-like glycosyltransferase